MKLCEINAIGLEKVDRHQGVIRGVRILGRESKNGRTYSDRALKEAAAKYEGVDVNVNHPDRSRPGSERRIEDAIGWLESIEIRADGVYGDLHYLKGHPSADLIAEAAERRSSRIGLSHNAQGTVVRKDGKNVVESIERVLSVDLVQNPATNAGLFESAGRTVRETLKAHAPELLDLLTEDAALLPPEAIDEPVEAAPAADSAGDVKAALVQMLTAIVELPGDIKSLCAQLIGVAQKIIAGQPDDKPAEGEAAEESGDSKDDQAAGDGSTNNETSDAAADDSAANPEAEDSANPFQKRKSPMAEQAATSKSTLEAENRQLKERLTLLEQKIELRDLEDHCRSLLERNRREVTEPRISALARMDDDAQRMVLIEDWAAIPEPEPPVRARPKPSFSAPAREKGDNIAYPKDIKAFVDSCR